MNTIADKIRKLFTENAPSLKTHTLKGHVHRNLVDNFSHYGPLFGVESLDEYEAMARKFFDDNLESNDPLCSRVELPHNRIGIDYNGQYRGIYEDDGTPVAFFQPNFRDLGYSNRDEELEDWRTGRYFNP